MTGTAELSSYVQEEGCRFRASLGYKVRATVDAKTIRLGRLGLDEATEEEFSSWLVLLWSPCPRIWAWG